jgi:iron complex outermembrane recepter protein
MEKQMTRNLFKKFGFIRIALAASVGIPLFIATSANAQAPAPPPEATTERVVVTGSLIPTAEEVTANPVDIFTSADIQRSGEATDILQVLEKRDPDFVGVGNIGQTNANISGGNGSSQIQIRGLPTLVLFENRRFANNATVALGAGEFSDVSIFPTALISRLEVLKDGASAQYGSDAVGGVVNVFLKDDFQGFEAGYRYGTTLEGSTAQRRAYVIAGVGNDTTQVMAAMQYYEMDPLFMRERFYSRLPLGGVTTTYGGTGRDNYHGRTQYYLIDQLVPAHWPLGSSVNSPLDFYAAHSIAPPPAASGTANPGQYAQMPLAYRFSPNGTTSSNREVVTYDLSFKPTSTLDLSSSTAYASFEHKICGDQLVAFGNFLFAHNHSEYDLNAQPLSNATGVVILGTMRINPLTGLIVPENRGAPAPYSPFQLSIDSNTLTGNYRLFANNRYQTNPRRFTNDNDFYRYLGGLKSQLTDADHGNWYTEAAAYYSNYQITFVNENLVNATALNALIAGQFDANGVLIPGTALDFFALDPIHNGSRSVDPVLFNGIFGDNIRELVTYSRAFDWIIRGFPFELPGGPVGVAGGVEYFAEGFKYQDSLEAFIGSVPTPASNHGRNVFGAFAEVRIPIVGSQQNIPFVYNFELDFSGRYDVYEGISGDSKVPKVMARYQPIKDVTIRGTYGNSFIAPDLFSLFGPTSFGFTPSITLNGVQQDQAQLEAVTNPNLTPSTAQSWTAGIVYSPHFVPGLTVSADYFWTLQQNIVLFLPSQLIIQSVEALGPASPYYNLITFGNFPGNPGATAVGGPGSLHDNLASAFVRDPLLNIGADRVEGLDLAIDYNWDIPHWSDMDWGQLELQVRSVVFLGHDRKIFPTDAYYNISGLIGDEGFGAFPDYKISFLVEHRWKGATLTLTANYIADMKNTVGVDPQTIDQNTLENVGDYITVDGRLSYTFHRAAPEAAVTAPEPKDAKDGKTAMGGKAVAGVETTSCWSVDHWLDGFTVAVGCNNILDEDPRIVVGGNSSTNLAVYDPFGRFVYFEVSKKF